MTFVKDDAAWHRPNAYHLDKDREFLKRLRMATLSELSEMQKDHRGALQWKRAAIIIAIRRVLHETELAAVTRKKTRAPLGGEARPRSVEEQLTVGRQVGQAAATHAAAVR